MTTGSEKIDKIDDLEAEIRDDGRALLVYVVLTLMWGFVGLWILVSGEWHGFVFGNILDPTGKEYVVLPRPSEEE